MRAELVGVGSELLGLGRRDSNGDWLQARLEEIGIRTALRTLVEDDPERIASVVRAALQRSAVAIVTGGLGPTEDDRTREGLARALDRPLERDPARLRRLGLEPDDGRARQADRPRGSAWIDNPVGSAPGLEVARGGCLLFALPGVPAEMKAMFRQSALPRLLELPRPRIVRAGVTIAGLRESEVDERIRDLYGAHGVEITILASPDAIELHFVTGDPSVAEAESRRRLERVEGEVRRRLGRAVVGGVGDRLAVAVGRVLARSGRTLATAESCTAGLLAATITSVAGSSAWYRGGFVVYDDQLKVALAGVSAETLREHGAVSEAVARELARGARERCGADAGLGVTGIAGPGGGSPDKPVGRVHVGLQLGNESDHLRLDLSGDRETVRRRSVAFALDRLRRRLLESG